MDNNNSTTTVPDESLSMFFDDEFNPSTYIDKLVNSITNTNPSSSATPMSAYSKTSLTKLSNDISHLMTHLDYYTNELTNETLQSKLDMLDKANVIINNSDDTTSTTRLQYHVHVLNNAILSLQNELVEINKQMDNSDVDNEAIQKLIQLKQVKSNLTKVLSIFELVNNSINPESKQSLTVDEFQNALDELSNNIKKQLETTEKKDKLLSHIDKLLELSTLFNQLSKFNPPFRKFITKLSNEKEAYMKR